jgi:hypothetical protein
MHPPWRLLLLPETALNLMPAAMRILAGRLEMAG